MITQTELSPPAVLAIDVGSGSCRALVFDAAGTLHGLAQREWIYHPVPGAPGGFDFDTRDGWEQVVTCIREGTQPRSDGASGLRVVRVLEGLQDSLAASAREAGAGAG